MKRLNKEFLWELKLWSRKAKKKMTAVTMNQLSKFRLATSTRTISQHSQVQPLRTIKRNSVGSRIPITMISLSQTLKLICKLCKKSKQNSKWFQVKWYRTPINYYNPPFLLSKYSEWLSHNTTRKMQASLNLLFPIKTQIKFIKTTKMHGKKSSKSKRSNLIFGHQPSWANSSVNATANLKNITGQRWKIATNTLKKMRLESSKRFWNSESRLSKPLEKVMSIGNKFWLLKF